MTDQPTLPSDEDAQASKLPGALEQNSISRRSLLQGGALLGLGVFLASGSPSAAQTGGHVIVTSSGGAYEDAWRTACWEPFTAETGIEVVPIVANTAKLIAMLDSGDIQVDVLDNSEFQFVSLLKAGGVLPFEYDRLTLTKKEDLLLTKDHYAGSYAYASVLAYNTGTVSGVPADWADAWDVEKFPGKRTFPDIASGNTFLEQAILSTGVSLDQVYPIDLDKAFEQLRKIKASVPKFYASGAESTQLFDTGTVDIGGVWNARIQSLISAGKPFAIQWNQSMRINQGFGVIKGAPNADNAWKLIDYSLQPKVLAAFAELIGYGPLVPKAYDFISAEKARLLPTSPDKVDKQFDQDPQWWSDNLAEVQQRFQKLLLL